MVAVWRKTSDLPHRTALAVPLTLTFIVLRGLRSEDATYLMFDLDDLSNGTAGRFGIQHHTCPAIGWNARGKLQGREACIQNFELLRGRRILLGLN